jgi:RHS repeat-associated protein
MFEVVFDYGDHDPNAPKPNDDLATIPGGLLKYPWKARLDPFSTYRAGFEVRTTRLCQRVLMFHHIPDLPTGMKGYDGLVRSTDFSYPKDLEPSNPNRIDPIGVARPVYTFLRSVTQTGYRRNNGGYDKRSLPPVEFEYTEPVVQEVVEEVDPESLENLPIGLEGSRYRWTDLHGEGISGILTEQAGAWFYKRNLSPIPERQRDGRELVKAQFAPLETVALKPNVTLSGGADFMDLAGDGQPDVVVMEGPIPGLYEHDEAEGWQTFRAFTSCLNRDLRDPNLKFVDLDGDGHADVLITEDAAFVWHASLAEEGFGPARCVAQALDEEKGPRIAFADGTQSIYLADLSGDGLTDIARIRNGEVCYWPNLGYGRFGAKVTMDNAPWFDNPDQFDHKRIRLADIDGSGTTDIIYLHRDGVRLYFNQSGNGWSQSQELKVFPRIDDLLSIVPTDLLGNGTACLVWSSPLPGDAQRPMRYVNLMGEQKPHLLVKIKNNLGATTEVDYAPSTKFYLQDKAAGKPWVTRLPFPVHVVERLSVTDKWRGTTFATTYSYHHGYFDGVEREFRGFGRVEQIDTEDYGKFSAGNIASSYITGDHELFQPPVKTVTWFHTGTFIDHGRVLSLYAEEYFPNWFEALSPRTVDVLGGFQENTLPEPDFADLDLTADEWREALRACKGMPLRQEIYELDIDALRKGEHEAVKLFSTAYHNCHIDRLQPRALNRHAVFLVTESEAITYHYELNLRAAEVKPDPRVAHTLNLRIDAFGRVLQSVAVGYPRFHPFVDDGAALQPQAVSLIREVQNELHIAYTETRYTDEDIDEPDGCRLRLPCDIKTYELTGIRTKDTSDSSTLDLRDDRYFSIDEFRAYRLSEHYRNSGTTVGLLQYHEQPDRIHDPPPAQKRLVEHVRTLYFDDASGTVAPTEPLAFGSHGPRGLKYEDYKLALTETLLTAVLGIRLDESIAGGSARQKLATAKTSGYLSGTDLAKRFKSLDTTGQYWMRSGVAGFAPDATRHFFLPERYTDPFDNVTEISFDSCDLYIDSTKDARGNETRVVDFDFRVVAPRAVQDANGNVTRAAFDILGMPVAVALESGGDSLAGLNVGLLNPSVPELVHFFTLKPYSEQSPRDWLARATTRFIYHFGEAVNAHGDVIGWEERPAAACSVQRETHFGRLSGAKTEIQVSIEYSDGSGNVLVKKAQAEPDPDSTLQSPPLRWIKSGKMVLNNKGKPVKQYEPHFSDTEHRFDTTEAEREVGVTPVMYYDAPGRLIRTEMADGTFSRVEFSPWFVRSFDQNDAVEESRWYRERLTAAERAAAISSVVAAEEQKAQKASAEDKRAANLAAKHANTPSETHLDSLGREVVSVTHNRTPSDDPTYANTALIDRPWLNERYLTFTKLDVEGKPLWICDARSNLVMQYINPPSANHTALWESTSGWHSAYDMPANAVPCYDIAGNLLFQHSMDAGHRWMISDAAGKPMLAWDANDKGSGSPVQTRLFGTEYDALHRPVKQWLKLDNATSAALIESFDYCDTASPQDANGVLSLSEAQTRNLMGQAIVHLDPSGKATVERIDLSGKPAHSTRILIKPDSADANGVVDWNGVGSLDVETFHQITAYDALGRMIRLYNWHRDLTFNALNISSATPRATNRVAIYEPAYNERGTLKSEFIYVRAGKTTDASGNVTPDKTNAKSRQAIQTITYNAKGQKLSLSLGNGTTTRYTYDDKTFRLIHLYTRRGSGFPGDCAGDPDAARPARPCGVQNLHYTYDPVGNIMHIQDDARQTVYFKNVAVEPSSDYIYDALYRLVQAAGREKNSAALSPPKPDEGPWPVVAFPSADATRNYTQSYVYDAVGNFVQMRHALSSGTGWTRRYATQPDSNQLYRTWYGDPNWNGSRTNNKTEYRHDIHGNMLNLNQTPEDWGLDIEWDWRDMILGFDCIGGGIATYQYGIDKQRTRKHITRLGGVVEDRVYLGGYELYRRRNAQDAVVEEIESHHLFEGDQRVLLVDDVIRTGGMTDPGPDGLSVNERTLFRYQYSNHLGSACLELDHQAGIISYEEYHPYGTSAYRLMESGVEAPAKRYRYTGMERDEESGLNYHGARYYAPVIARWQSADPKGISEGLNRFMANKGNPIRFVDTNGREDRDTILGNTASYKNQPPRGIDKIAEHMIPHKLMELLTTIDPDDTSDAANYLRQMVVTGKTGGKTGITKADYEKATTIIWEKIAANLKTYGKGDLAQIRELKKIVASGKSVDVLMELDRAAENFMRAAAKSGTKVPMADLHAAWTLQLVQYTSRYSIRVAHATFMSSMLNALKSVGKVAAIILVGAVGLASARTLGAEPNAPNEGAGQPAFEYEAVRQMYDAATTENERRASALIGLNASLTTEWVLRDEQNLRREREANAESAQSWGELLNPLGFVNTRFPLVSSPAGPLVDLSFKEERAEVALGRLKAGLARMSLTMTAAEEKVFKDAVIDYAWSGRLDRK